MGQEILSLLKNMFRVGTVTAIDEQKGRVRVTFDDLDNTVSNWLQVAVRGAYQDDEHWLPDIEEQVQCFLMPTGNSEGYVLFSVRDGAHPPKAGKVGRRYIRFADGSSVEHDRETSTMTVVCAGPVNITATGNVHVSGDVIADGISLKTHVHGGVMSGGSTTSGPQ